MKRVLLLFLVLCSCNAFSQSEKIKKKAYQWRNEEIDKLDFKGNNNTTELCQFFHQGIFKGKVYPEFVNQNPGEVYPYVGCKNGCLLCTYFMGMIYLHPNPLLKVPPYYAEAVPFFKKLAEQGDVRSMMILARDLYEDPKSTQKDATQAKYWYAKAAEKGDSIAIVKTEQYKASASNPYEAGLKAYNNKDYAEAIKQWTVAVNYNANGEAAYNLGVMYATGDLVPKNLFGAHHFLDEAARLGVKKGLALNGEMYYQEFYYLDALHYLQEAKNNGYAINQQHLDKVIAYKKDLDDKIAKENALNDAYDASVRLHAQQAKDAAAAKANQQTLSNTPQNNKSTKKCPYCSGSGTVTSASSKSLEQDKNGRWYNVYTPSKTSQCSYCKGTGTL